MNGSMRRPSQLRLAGTFGNEGRNQLTGPGLATTNLSVSKTFAIWEQVKLQIRADADNLFNHPSFGLPANTITQCPTSGTGTPPAGCTAFNGAIATGSSTITGVTVPAAPCR